MKKHQRKHFVTSKTFEDSIHRNLDAFFLGTHIFVDD